MKDDEGVVGSAWPLARKKVFVLLLLAGAVSFVFSKRGLSRWWVVFFPSKKELSHKQRIVKLYRDYEQVQLSAKDKSNLAPDADFDFSKTLLLIEEVNNIVKEGPFLDLVKDPGKRHLLWLKQELEQEEIVFFEFLAVRRRGGSVLANARARRSLQFYTRAIKNSLAKINGFLLKIRNGS